MFFRAIALSLAVMIGIGTIVPLATEQVEAGTKKKYRKKQAKRYKKYSKGWWRQYRARMKRKRAIQMAKRKLRLRQLRLEQARAAEKSESPVKTATKPSSTVSKKPETMGAPAVLPSGDPAPAGWKAAPSTSAELQFRVDNSSGVQIGSASIAVVGPSMAAGAGRKSIGGVPMASLRRDVIDRMVKENGWVVNDYQKDVDGQPVYVVVAQSQAKNGSVQSRMFYFTEVDGRIYSVTTNSPAQESERLAEESEKVINSLKSRVRPSQRAAVTQ